MAFNRSKSSTTNNTFDLTQTKNDARLVEGDNANVGGNVDISVIGAIGGDSGGGAGSGVGRSVSNLFSGRRNNSDGVPPGINVVTTDFGALDTGRQIADAAFGFANNAQDSANTIALDSVSASRNIANSAVGLASEATRDEQARTIQFVIIGAVVIASIFFIAQTFKK